MMKVVSRVLYMTSTQSCELFTYDIKSTASKFPMGLLYQF